MNVPTFARLRGDIGKTYFLAGPWEGQVPAELKSAAEGVPMNRRYCCYSAELALPMGAWLPQSTCTVIAGDESWPGLLLTPIGPDDEGRQCLQMVFHYLTTSPQESASEAADA